MRSSLPSTYHQQYSPSISTSTPRKISAQLYEREAQEETERELHKLSDYLSSQPDVLPLFKVYRQQFWYQWVAIAVAITVVLSTAVLWPQFDRTLCKVPITDNYNQSRIPLKQLKGLIFANLHLCPNIISSSVEDFFDPEFEHLSMLLEQIKLLRNSPPPPRTENDVHNIEGREEDEGGSGGNENDDEGVGQDGKREARKALPQDISSFLCIKPNNLERFHKKLADCFFFIGQAIEGAEAFCRNSEQELDQPVKDLLMNLYHAGREFEQLFWELKC